MQVNVLLPAVTSLLGLGFAGMMLVRFRARRQPCYLAWGLGLVWYAVAAGTEALGGAQGWTVDLYRAWYITGAIGVAAFLGAGSLYLHRTPAFGSLTVVWLLAGCAPALAGRHSLIGLLGLAAAGVVTAVLTWRPAWFAHAVFAVLVVASVLAAVEVLTASVDPSLLPQSAEQVVSGQAFDAETRALTPPFNIPGALVLLSGAALSAVHFWRTRALPRRVAANLFIAVGAFVPSLASGLTRYGITSVFFVGELVGLICILAGFLLSGATSPPPSVRPSAPPQAPALPYTA
ncbi:MAG: hypothetical protein M3069_24665 [Chloroflexota bacterium]|nr:hypothetical protein [Chloroflexota bacterium]